MSKNKNKPSLEISANNEIISFIHCKKCFEELPDGVSPKEYADYDIGYTEIGIQMWCNRHECNVVHMDFAGQKFHANISTSEDEKNKIVN